MPKKKSIRKCASRFSKEVADIEQFLRLASPSLSVEHTSWIHEYAILRLYRGFERLMLESLVGAINNDTQLISQTAGVQFPKHLTDEVCQYIVAGQGYLEIHGRDGLIRTIKRFVPDTHYLPTTVKSKKYKRALEQMIALRNMAAHSSDASKRRAKEATGNTNLGSAGAWLKSQSRMTEILRAMARLALEIRMQAPY